MSLKIRIEKLEDKQGITDEPFRLFVFCVPTRTFSGWKNQNEIFWKGLHETEDEFMDRINMAIQGPELHVLHGISANDV